VEVFGRLDQAETPIAKLQLPERLQSPSVKRGAMSNGDKTHSTPLNLRQSRIGVLEFGACLELGAWNLVLRRKDIPLKTTQK
jgi:hypothetical protein